MYLRGPVQPPVSALLVKAATALKISASVIWKILCSCQKQQTIRGQTYVFAAGAIKVTFLHFNWSQPQVDIFVTYMQFDWFIYVVLVK